jgi:hypothetical protein
VRARVGDLQQRLAAWARPDSLAARLRQSRPAPPAAVSGADYHPHVWAGLAGFARAVRGADAAGAELAARRLIGLGPGLTPAADDALGGLLAAGRFVARLLGGNAARWREAARVVRRVARSRTTALSEALLRQASVGAVSETLGDLLRALAAPTPAAVERALARTLALGHTSGADAALGVLLGARLALGLLPGARPRPEGLPSAWPRPERLPSVRPQPDGLLSARSRPGGLGQSPRGGREGAW